MPFFSVVIASYNRAPYIAATLNSIRVQQFKDYEVIVVDDGSTDNTLEVLRAYPEVKVFTQQNKGPGVARNHGVSESSGKYIAFLDSDDLWFPWTLQIYARIVCNGRTPAFIAGKPFCFRHDGELSQLNATPLRTSAFSDYLESGDAWRWWGVSSFVVRAETLRAVGGFAEKNMNGEDADLALKLGVAPGFVQIQAPATFAYRKHLGNLTDNLSKLLAGAWHKVHSEQACGYPGGEDRAIERRRILTRHVRPVTLQCLRQRAWREAWALYAATFRWHVRLRRWKYLAGFPLKALCS